MSDYSAKEPCPLLLEFAHLEGFPRDPKPEKYSWNSTSRIERFRTELDELTKVLAESCGGEININHLRTVAARNALRYVDYEPIPEPEPAPPADPVDELDTPPAREEEIR